MYETLRYRFTTAHSLTGAALGLLLVFRTNSAYARVYDARCIWGQLTNTIREMSRLAHTNMQVCARARMLAYAVSCVLMHAAVSCMLTHGEGTARAHQQAGAGPRAYAHVCSRMLMSRLAHTNMHVC